MDKRVLAAIAADAAELGRALASEGVQTARAKAAIVAGAMPAIAAYEINEGPYGRQPAGDRTLEDTGRR